MQQDQADSGNDPRTRIANARTRLDMRPYQASGAGIGDEDRVHVVGGEVAGLTELHCVAGDGDAGVEVAVGAAAVCSVGARGAQIGSQVENDWGAPST